MFHCSRHFSNPFEQNLFKKCIRICWLRDFSRYNDVSNISLKVVFFNYKRRTFYDFADFFLPPLAFIQQKLSFWHISVHPPIGKFAKLHFPHLRPHELSRERFSTEILYKFPNRTSKPKPFRGSYVFERYKIDTAICLIERFNGTSSANMFVV